MQYLDKQGRSILIEDSGTDVIALHNGKRVGCLEFDEADAGPFLWSVAVEMEYRRSGVATAMMRRAVEIHGKDFGKPTFQAVGGSQAREAHEYYTEEGSAFIWQCVQFGLLTPPYSREDDHDEWGIGRAPKTGLKAP